MEGTAAKGIMKFSAYGNYMWLHPFVRTQIATKQQAKIERTTHPILLFINNILHFETTMEFSDVASCYICLDEGPDEAGKPLVRDCSCRGDTAGFAHLSCIIEYAEQKSKQAADRRLGLVGLFYAMGRMQQLPSTVPKSSGAGFILCIYFVRGGSLRLFWKRHVG